MHVFWTEIQENTLTIGVEFASNLSKGEGKEMHCIEYVWTLIKIKMSPVYKGITECSQGSL